MAFMLKLQWNIKSGSEADFRANQETLCNVMIEHPGVITYHADYPSDGVSEWVEVYATNESFVAHLENEKGKGPLGALIEACDSIVCQCWGDPDEGSREILKNFGATYHDTGSGSFVLNPVADKDSLI